MDSITFRAPAKVNLFLRVLGKREDGYHTIETLFEKIALFDKIILKKRSAGVSLRSKAKGLPEEKENIAYKAADLMKKKYGLSGVAIEMEKSIPIGAGLGGGSSDAAAVLTGINELYGLDIPKSGLAALAGELGADVPFFVSGSTWAVGRSRGDEIEEVEINTMLWHILISPPSSLSSKDAYEWIDTKKKSRSPAIEKTIAALKRNDIKSLGHYLYNELEGLSFERFAQLKGFKDILAENGIQGALISGSGPTLLGISGSEEEVVRLKKRIEERKVVKAQGWQVLVAPTLYN